jgi:hypothetical protein
MARSRYRCAHGHGPHARRLNAGVARVLVVGEKPGQPSLGVAFGDGLAVVAVKPGADRGRGSSGDDQFQCQDNSRSW